MIHQAKGGIILSVCESKSGTHSQCVQTILRFGPFQLVVPCLEDNTMPQMMERILGSGLNDGD